MLNAGDLPPFYKFKAYQELLYTSWFNGVYGTSYYGFPAHGGANYLLFWVLGFLSSGDMVIAQRIYVLFPLFFSPISVYVLLSKFVKHDVAKLAGTLIYSFNFISIQFFLGFYTIYQFYAFLPIVIYAYYCLIEEPNVINLLKLAILIGLVDIFWNHSILILIQWIIILTITRFLMIKNLRSYTHSLITLMSGVILGVLGLGLTSYIEPLSLLLMGKSFSIYSVPITNEYITEHVVYSFHNKASINNGLALTFMVAPALFLLLHPAKLKHKFYVIEFFLVFSLLSIYYWTATTTIIPKSFALLIGMLDLTEPWKVQVSLALCLSVLLSALFDYLLDLRLHKNFRLSFLKMNISYLRDLRLRSIFIALFLIILMIGNFTHNYYNESPTIGLLTGYNPYRPNNAVVDPAFYQIYQLITSLIPSNIPYRILWIPSDPYTDNLINSIFYRDQIVPSWSPNIKSILDPIINNSTVEYGHILALANVRAIVINLEPALTATQYLSWYQGTPRLQHWGLGNISAWYAIGDPKYYVALINQQKDLRLVYSSKQFVIYENLAYAPIIQAYQTITVIPDILIQRPYLVTYSKNMLNTSLLGWNVYGGFLKYCAETPNGDGSCMMAVNNGHSYFLVEQNIKIRDDDQYIFSGWIKGHNTLYSGIQIAFFDPDGKQIEVQDILPWMSGNFDWKQFIYQVIPPTGSYSMTILLWPGQKGASMYYNLSLVKGYMVPTATSSEIYNMVSQLKSPVNFSNTLFLNWNTSSEFGMLITLYPYLPDQSLIPLKGYWLHGLNDSVVMVGESAAEFPIYVPEDGNYQLLISGKGITYLNLTTKSGRIELLERSDGYIMSKAFHLSRGSHIIYLSSNSSKTLLNLLLFIKTVKEITYTDLREIVNNKPVIFTKFLSLTQYYVEVPSHNYPLLILMDQTYDSRWVLVNNKTIASRPLGGKFFTINAFVINPSTNKVAYRLIFVSNWPFIVNLWLGLWVITITAFIALYIVSKRRSQHRG